MRRHEKALGILANGIRVLDWDHADIVIVGNGIAGLTAALEARRLAPEKRIVIMTEQSHPTIYTPALKQFAAGKMMQDQLLASPAGTERAVQIEVINTSVEEIHSKGKSLCLRGGQRFGYDTLLLATGSKPNGLPAAVPGRHFDGVLTLHRLSDYLDLSRRLRLREVHQAVVIGGGLHALETVMVLLHWGIRVYWLIRGATFLPSMLDHTASEMILEHSRHAGAKVSTETEVVGIVGRIGTVVGVVTNHQQTIPCQLVALCTGTTPVTTLAERCDVPLKQQLGIHVDEYLQTSVRDIYAAGDAALWNSHTGAYQSRKYWYAAVAQGRVAAAAMTGYQERTVPFGVPWHAIQLGKLSLLSVGDPLHGTLEVATVINTRKGSYRRLAVRDERLVGYLSLGPTQPDSLAIKRMIDEGLSIRDIEQVLLTGEFDARRHFAQRRTHAAQTLAVTGKFAEPGTPLPLFRASPEAETTHDTEPLFASSETEAKYITEPLILTPLLSKQHEVRDVTDPLQKRVERQTPRISSITSLMNKPVETRWIVPALLPEGLVVLAGKQKAGKSWLGLAMGLAVASGATVLGNIGVEQGHVLYLALEESERRLQERLRHLLVLGTSLHQDFEYTTSWPRMNDDGLADIEAWLISHPQARLVIIDSWTKVQPEIEQHADRTAHDAEYEAFEKLRELAYAYHVSILIHFHLAQAPADQFVNELTAMSGTNACTDAILHLKRSRENKDAVLSGTGRAYAQALDHTLSFNDGCWKLVGHAGVRTLDTLSQARSAIIKVLHEEDRPMQPGEIALALGKRDGTIRKMLGEMKASSLVQATEQGYIALVPEKEEQTTRRRNRNDAGKSRSSGDGRHNDKQRQAQNIVQFQGPLPRSKKEQEQSIVV